MKNLINSRMRNLIYAALIILPSVFTGNMYSVINDEDTTHALLSNLTALSTSVHTGIRDRQNHLNYSLQLLLSQEAFHDFDLAGMSSHINQLIYYNATLSNAYIMNQSHEVIYGINDTTLSGSNHTSHINAALNGDISYYSSFVDDVSFTQLAAPIYSHNNTIQPEGVLVMTYSFMPLETELKALNSSSPGINAYLIDINGRILSASSNQSVRWSNRSIDIATIKRTIDYDSTTSFTLFDETPLMGIYYVIPDTSWTLLITSTPPENINVSDIFSWLSGLLGVGGISTAEALRKRKLVGTAPLSELTNIQSL